MIKKQANYNIVINDIGADNFIQFNQQFTVKREYMIELLACDNQPRVTTNCEIPIYSNDGNIILYI